MLKNDRWIIEKAKEGMIFPFSDKQVREEIKIINGTESIEKIISWGTSSFGYDIRLGSDFAAYYNFNAVDPKQINNENVHFSYNVEDTYVLQAGEFVLATSVETFNIPRNVTVIAVGKSSYCRVGLSTNISPVEAEFKGQITLELSNQTKHPIVLHVGEGISQLLFFESDEDCITSYNDRPGGGKYQGQKGITLPRV